MKAVILAGGLGTRLSEETQLKPKPMVEIGGKPILWHIMKLYGAFGVKEFVICCGYKGHLIKEYFANYFMYESDLTVDMANRGFEVHQTNAEPWKVTLVDTGEDTMTGGRLKRVADYIKDERSFFFTYGDGVANIDILALNDFHHTHGKLATVTAVRPPARYGALDIHDSAVKGFIEKPEDQSGFINGGFFVLSPKVLDYIADEKTPWESDPLQQLARDGELMAYKHIGFWQPMDTLREKTQLETLWRENRAPWKLW